MVSGAAARATSAAVARLSRRTTSLITGDRTRHSAPMPRDAWRPTRRITPSIWWTWSGVAAMRRAAVAWSASEATVTTSSTPIRAAKAP